MFQNLIQDHPREAELTEANKSKFGIPCKVQNLQTTKAKPYSYTSVALDPL